jgi:GT2 family glycosyltransferase
MAIRRSDFVRLGMMAPVTETGSSLWCDVEFAYRAHLNGFRFRRTADADAYHDDAASRDFGVASQRAFRAAAAAPALFARHPDLEAYLPMFADKRPIRWGIDPPPLVARKAVRSLSAARPSRSFLIAAVKILEAGGAPAATLLPPLYRWLIGTQLYLGIRAERGGTAESRPEA